MPETVLALGMFDGMHLGHKKLIDTAVQIANKNNLTPAVFTFSIHPQQVTAGRTARLLTNEQRAELMKRLGVERIDEIEFTKEFSNMSPERFMDMLVERMAPGVIVAGFNYTFGKNKSGDAARLQALALKRGVDVAIVPPFLVGKQPVSSTRIREMLEKGDADGAQLLLGRPYSLSGIIVENRRIGRTIGFPTANIDPDPARVIPADGVYMSMAALDGAYRPSVTSIGTNPTVGGTKRTVETHILDFDEDGYGRQLAVSFIRRIRPVKAFSGLDELKAQITKDTDAARRYFGL